MWFDFSSTFNTVQTLWVGKQAHRDADGRPKGVLDHGLSHWWVFHQKCVFILENTVSISLSSINLNINSPTNLTFDLEKWQTQKTFFKKRRKKNAERFCEFLLNYCVAISSHFPYVLNKNTIS